MEDSGTTFDEELPVDTGSSLGNDTSGARGKTFRVVASNAGLAIEGWGSIPHDQIATAFCSPRQAPHVVIEDRMGRRLTIHVESPERARRLLSALHCTTSEKNAVFRVLPPFHFPTVGGLLLPLGVLGLLSLRDLGLMPVVVCCVAIISVLLALNLFKRKLVVGRDGITLKSLFGKRFVSFADITSTNRYSDARTPRRTSGRNEIVYSGVVVHLRSGEALRLPTTRGAQSDDELLGASERVREALTAWQATQPIDDALLSRAGRSTQDWISNLRTLGHSEGTTYRVASINREALFTIVEDPANQAVSRVAAAIAIGAKLDDEARTRLKASAEAMAAPELRIAIEHVIDDKPQAELEPILNDLDPIDRAER